MATAAWIVLGFGAAGVLVGGFGFMLTDDGTESRATGCSIGLMVGSGLVTVMFLVGVLVVFAPSQPIRIIIVSSLITAVALFVLDPPDAGTDNRRARRRERLAWTLMVVWACVVVWQIRVVVVSDASVQDKIEFVGPIIGVALALPAYFLVIAPLQRWLELGEIGERLLCLAVALAVGLIVQEVGARLGLIPRL